MQGFKGLLPRQILNDDIFTPIFNKAEENQKAAQVCNDFFQLLNKFFESFTLIVEKNVIDSDIGNVNASFYRLIGFVCSRLLKENKQLTDNTKISSRELTKICNAILEDFSKFMQGFQTNVRKYLESEQILQELSKKYYRSHKNMISSMDSYKNSFTDVTLIYNMDEKTKRYQTCENNYKCILAEYKAIGEKVDSLSDRKASICKNYDDLEEEFAKVIRLIGSRVIGETKNFVGYYSSANKSISTFLAEQKFNLEKEKLKPFFANIEDTTKKEYFQENLPHLDENSVIPIIFEYPQYIKDEYLEAYNIEMLNYLKKVEEFADKRKSENKRVSDLFLNYFKNIEKYHIQGVKEIVQNFDKLKKKLTDSFGPRLASFVKSINAIFELLSGIDEKLVKNVNSKLTQNQSFFNEEGKLLKLFSEELKSNIEKFIGKKELKKLKEEEFTEESTMVNIPSFRKEVNQKAGFIKHFILGFYDKMSKNSEKISKLYTEIIHDIGESTNEFYSLCCEYQELYFGPEEFQKNFQKYEADVNSLLQKNKSFFEELPFNVLKTENCKIVFDGDWNKIEDFKKLKKPTPVENLRPVTKETPKEDEIKENEGEKPNEDTEAHPRRSESAGKLSNPHLQELDMKNSRKVSMKDFSSVDEKEIKNVEFLMEKIEFKENESFLKSFACALSEKIILQGRIYITNERICFSSGFNSSNLFFGKTFLQFPKEDITKIEKRLNALFMDNSISFTTVKGELFFTSFFSRDEAYDLVCKTFGFNLDEHVYEFDEVTEKEIPQIIVDIKEDDDINEDELGKRKEQIEVMMAKFSYSDHAHFEFTKEGLNAYQIFKIFYSDSEIMMNRRKYPNFLVYFKELLGHKDVDVSSWDPPLEKTMNQSNIKTNSPLLTTRKIKATVPVANSGVPFMPKHAQSEEKQTLFFFSKHHWVLEGEVSTSGAPYTDTFKVQLRTTVTSDENGKCRILMSGTINFVKNTMMKAVIESKSQEETIRAAKLSVDQMKKYFEAVEKQNKAQNVKPGNEIENLKEELELKTTEIDNLMKEKESLEKERELLKVGKQKDEKIMVGLVAFIIILLILLLS